LKGGFGGTRQVLLLVILIDWESTQRRRINTTMKNTLKTLVVLTATLGFATLASPQARAAFTITDGVNVTPFSGSTLDTLDGASADPLVSFTGVAGYESGSAPNDYADPLIGSATAAAFGQTPGIAGNLTSEYAAVQNGGTATMTFSAPEDYLGILWGSVDGYNTLSFYDGSTLIGSLTGDNVLAGANGTQSEYVNIKSSSAFTKVVASSSWNSFEFADLAYKAAPGAPTPPITASLAFAGILLLQALRRKTA
jgi:hypothetical protein